MKLAVPGWFYLTLFVFVLETLLIVFRSLFIKVSSTHGTQPDPLLFVGAIQPADSERVFYHLSLFFLLAYLQVFQIIPLDLGGKQSTSKDEPDPPDSDDGV